MVRRINELDLKEACVQAARAVIARQGVEAWSMRDVARALDISHQAPYRHFPSRDHLLAEVMRRCFEDFAVHLDQQASAQAADPLRGMGQGYLDYAQAKPLEYRLMFGTPWPEPAAHPELVRHAAHAFGLLRTMLRQRHAGSPQAGAQADQEALFIWAGLHGLASIRQADVMSHLALAPEVQQAAPAFMLHMIGHALKGQTP